MDGVDQEITLAEQLATLRRDLKKKLARAIRAEKACDKLASSSALKQYPVVTKHLAPLADADLTPFELEEQRQEVVRGLTALRERLKGLARVAVMNELRETVPEVSLLGDTPVTLLVPPLTVELDFESAEAKLLYARETVGQCLIDGKAILAARQKATDDIRKRALPSETFFVACQRAYQTVVIARGLADGDRVDLVDLLAPLALLDQSVDRWRTLGPGEGKQGIPPYPRALLAYQLQRLRREDVLCHGGRRLELGTATAGSTKNKRNVMFIPSSPTEGQYYLSIRFVRTG